MADRTITLDEDLAALALRLATDPFSYATDRLERPLERHSPAMLADEERREQLINALEQQGIAETVPRARPPFADLTLDDALELARQRLDEDSDAHADEALLGMLYECVLEDRAKVARREFVAVVVSFSDWRGDSWARGPFPTEEAAHEWAKSKGLEDATDCSREGDVGDEYLVREVIAA